MQSSSGNEHSDGTDEALKSELLGELFSAYPNTVPLSVLVQKFKTNLRNKKAINRNLYALEKEKVVAKCGDAPPSWQLLEKGKEKYESHSNQMSASVSSASVSHETYSTAHRLGNASLSPSPSSYSQALANNLKKMSKYHQSVPSPQATNSMTPQQRSKQSSRSDVIRRTVDFYKMHMMDGLKHIKEIDDLIELHLNGQAVAITFHVEGNNISDESSIQVLIEEISDCFLNFKSEFLLKQRKIKLDIDKNFNSAKEKYHNIIRKKCVGISEEEFNTKHREAVMEARTSFDAMQDGKETDFWKQKDELLKRIFVDEGRIFYRVNRLQKELKTCKERIRELEKQENEGSRIRNTFFYSPSKVLTINGDEGFLGRGGFGCVRVGFVDVVGLVAVKCVAITGSRGDIEEKKQKFKEEVEICRLASHENVVKVEGYTVWSDSMGIIMEYMAGGNLWSLVLGTRGRIPTVPEIPFTLCLRFCADITSGINFLHNGFRDQRITHGDLKPENVLLTSDLRCKISDFGGSSFATCTNSYQLAQPLQRSSEFTQGYAAPERHGAPRPSKAMDVFSVSAMIRVILTREPPSADSISSSSRGANAVLTQIDDLKQDLDFESRNAIDLMKEEMDRCWQHDPNRRPPVSEVRDKFNNHLSTVSVASMAQHVTDVLRSMEIKIPSHDSHNCEPISNLQHPFR